MTAWRRAAPSSGLTAALALLPALVWLAPALLEQRAPVFRDQGDFFYPLKLYTAGPAPRARGCRSGTRSPAPASPGSPTRSRGSSTRRRCSSCCRRPRSPRGSTCSSTSPSARGAPGASCARRAHPTPAALAGAAALCRVAGLPPRSRRTGTTSAPSRICRRSRLARARRAALAPRRRGASRRSSGFRRWRAARRSPAATLVLAAVFAALPRPPPSTGLGASRRQTRTVARLAAGALLGLALAGWVLVPMGELAATSDRRARCRRRERGRARSGSLPSARSSRLGGGSSGTSYLSSLVPSGRSGSLSRPPRFAGAAAPPARPPALRRRARGGRAALGRRSARRVAAALPPLDRDPLSRPRPLR